jgi:hypothetical protein
MTSVGVLRDTLISKRPNNLELNKKNASASFDHASAFATFKTSRNHNTFVINLAALHHMVRDRSMLNSFVAEHIPIKTGISCNNLCQLESLA